MPYTYIEDYYGTRFEPGMRVCFTEGKKAFGTVRKPRGDPQYVSVRFDAGHVGECHPKSLDICAHCVREPERGWIEQDNNGPIVPCPVCNSEGAYSR